MIGPDMAALKVAADNVLKSVSAKLTQGEVPAALYGLGFLGRWALPRLKASGIDVVGCYDANAALTGSLVEGVPVHAASDLERDLPAFVVVTARHAIGPVSARLSSLGVAHVSYDAWHVASQFDLFREVHDDILADDRSRTVLRAVLMAMLTGDYAYCEAVFEKDQYFCLPRFCGAGQDIYVDAGAFVGDSAERFIWAHDGIFSKIYAFEPGPRQFAALKARIGRLTAEWALDPGGIELVAAGLGERDRAAVATSDSGQMTSLAADHQHGGEGLAIDIVSLDGFLAGRPITFLKADVEGMEMALLQGAQSTIRTHKPKIAVCVYHYPIDIPAIATYLRELAPSYKFALRHHSPRLMETVLYCWSD